MKRNEEYFRKVFVVVALRQHLGISPLRVGRMPRLTFQVRAAQVEVRDALRKLIDIAYHVRRQTKELVSRVGLWMA